MGFNFEKPEIYKKAVNFASNIYKITKRFPAKESCGLVSQLRRALVPISANIAEGSGRYNKRKFTTILG